MNLFRSLTEKHWYRWLVIGLCFLMIFITLGFCSTNKGLYLAAITDALKIKRSLFSIGDSLRYITTCIVNIFFGALVAKFGTKKLIFTGFCFLILTMVCYITTDSVIGFWIGGVFLGAGLSFTTTAMVGCIVNRWCRSNKGTIMGAVLAANGIGGALAAQIVMPIIYSEGDPFGYRKAYPAAALLPVPPFFPAGRRFSPCNLHKRALSPPRLIAKSYKISGAGNKKLLFWFQ